MFGFRKHTVNGGKINRASFKPGDIFIHYNDDLKRNYFKLPQMATGNISYSSFAHGGLIISDKYIMHAGTTSEGPIAIEKIANSFSNKREYRIYRPVNSLLAAEIVEVAIDLYWNKYIPFAGIVSIDNHRQVIDYLKVANEYGTNRGLIRLPGKGGKVKALDEIRAEYRNMLKVTPDLENKIAVRRKEIENEIKNRKENGDKFTNLQEEAFVKNKMEQYLATLTPTNVKAKKFFCTQFVTWVVQAAAGVLHERDPLNFQFDIADVLDIRDTKSIPSRLADLLKHSQHFIEFKSEENFKQPLNNPEPIIGVASTAAEIANAETKLRNILMEADQVVATAEADERKIRSEVSNVVADLNQATRKLNHLQADWASDYVDVLKMESELARLEAGGRTALSLTSAVINWISGYKPAIFGTTAATLSMAVAKQIPILSSNIAEKKARMGSLKLHIERAKLVGLEAMERTEKIESLFKLSTSRLQGAVEQRSILQARVPFINTRMLDYDGIGPLPSPKKWLAPLPPLPPKRQIPPLILPSESDLDSTSDIVLPTAPSAVGAATMRPGSPLDIHVQSGAFAPESSIGAMPSVPDSGVKTSVKSKGYAPAPPTASNRVNQMPSTVPLVAPPNQGKLHHALSRPKVEVSRPPAAGNGVGQVPKRIAPPPPNMSFVAPPNQGRLHHVLSKPKNTEAPGQSVKGGFLKKLPRPFRNG